MERILKSVKLINLNEEITSMGYNEYYWNGEKCNMRKSGKHNYCGLRVFKLYFYRWGDLYGVVNMVNPNKERVMIIVSDKFAESRFINIKFEEEIKVYLN